MSGDFMDARHNRYMDIAIDEARKAEACGEIPVGAIVVDMAGAILGRGFNQSISKHDPTAHAEILALGEAGRSVGNYRLGGAVMYSTIEPCSMCAGAMIHARIGTLCFGAADPKAGSAGSIYNILGDPRLNHQVQVIRGIRGAECSALLQEFFARTRGR